MMRLRTQIATSNVLVICWARSLPVDDVGASGYRFGVPRGERNADDQLGGREDEQRTAERGDDGRRQPTFGELALQPYRDASGDEVNAVRATLS